MFPKHRGLPTRNEGRCDPCPSGLVREWNRRCQELFDQAASSSQGHEAKRPVHELVFTRCMAATGAVENAPDNIVHEQPISKSSRFFQKKLNIFSKPRSLTLF
jgi:hypothetical protein